MTLRNASGFAASDLLGFFWDRRTAKKPDINRCMVAQNAQSRSFFFLFLADLLTL